LAPTCRARARLPSPQDTRRILQEEISGIRTEIFRRESSAKYDEDKKRANELGYGALPGCWLLACWLAGCWLLPGLAGCCRAALAGCMLAALRRIAKQW
jgi:hypothetical protein